MEARLEALKDDSTTATITKNSPTDETNEQPEREISQPQNPSPTVNPPRSEEIKRDEVKERAGGVLLVEPQPIVADQDDQTEVLETRSESSDLVEDSQSNYATEQSEPEVEDNAEVSESEAKEGGEIRGVDQPENANEDATFRAESSADPVDQTNTSEIIAVQTTESIIIENTPQANTTESVVQDATDAVVSTITEIPVIVIEPEQVAQTNFEPIQDPVSEVRENLSVILESETEEQLTEAGETMT